MYGTAPVNDKWKANKYYYYITPTLKKIPGVNPLPQQNYWLSH
jgi:hypothetical protein